MGITLLFAKMKLVLFFAGLAAASQLDEHTLEKKIAESRLRVKRGWLDPVSTTGATTAGDSTTTAGNIGGTTACTGWLCPVPTTLPRQVSQDELNIEQTDRFIAQYGLTSVNKWKEWKDELEENENIPEEEVDELERCTSKCKRTDRWNDLRGKAHEEVLEANKKARENGQSDIKDPIACKKCVRYIPKKVDAPKQATFRDRISQVKSAYKGAKAIGLI